MTSAIEKLDKHIACVETFRWVGGEHIGAWLIIHNGEQHERITLEYPLTQKQATYLNKNDNTLKTLRLKGDMSTRFFTIEHVYASAKKTLVEQYPNIILLLESKGFLLGWLLPQKVVMAPTKKITNKLSTILKKLTTLEYDIVDAHVTKEDEEKARLLDQQWEKEIAQLLPRIEKLKSLKNPRSIS